MTVHVADPKQLSTDALALLFNEARTHNAFVDKPVPEDLLRQAVDLAKMAPDQRQPVAAAGRLPALEGGQAAARAGA